ncbi:MAG: hypothetical protein Q7S58_07295 [Candidatus Binatus sp.]|uniref:hypothetical protein n=1 Tax=Candidatus Binatus sp. TaxID=2811406 RepID=UPI002726BFDB|nr:hypothetical protein [Candidatus Binatus sp.]MDO8432200.1 hypothetical protein [Candidatus Binatus sp.]
MNHSTAIACFIQMVRDAFSQSLGRTAFVSGALDVAGSVFAFAVFTAVAIALWVI